MTKVHSLRYGERNYLKFKVTFENNLTQLFNGDDLDRLLKGHNLKLKTDFGFLDGTFLNLPSYIENSPDSLNIQLVGDSVLLYKSYPISLYKSYNLAFNGRDAKTYYYDGEHGGNGKSAKIKVSKTKSINPIFKFEINSGYSIEEIYFNPENGTINIDCSGGNGANGLDGRSGEDEDEEYAATPGEKGGNGGNGGDGGKIYLSIPESFIPYKNKIQVNYSGGKGGKGGSGGKGGKLLTQEGHWLLNIIVPSRADRGDDGLNGSDGVDGLFEISYYE